MRENVSELFGSWLFICSKHVSFPWKQKNLQTYELKNLQTYELTKPKNPLSLTGVSGFYIIFELDIF